MRTSRLFWVALCLAVPLHAQQSELSASASPPPLPSPPYVKSPPASAQWLITFSQGNAGTVKPTARPPAMNNQEGLAKKSVVVTRNPGILLETTALQNGTVTRRIRTPALSVTLLSGSSAWLPSSGGQNGFSETDYSKNDFAGFDWLSQKNYVGVQEIAKRPCFVFHDQVVTADPPELDLIRTSIEKTFTTWKVAKENRDREAAASTSANRGSKVNRQAPPTASPTPSPEDTPPPGFDLKNYMRDATAYIDVETGLPTLLTYRTQEQGVETRAYSFMSPPNTPLTLPPEAQVLLENNQARLKRLTGPDAAP